MRSNEIRREVKRYVLCVGPDEVTATHDGIITYEDPCMDCGDWCRDPERLEVSYRFISCGKHEFAMKAKGKKTNLGRPILLP